MEETEDFKMRKKKMSFKKIFLLVVLVLLLITSSYFIYSLALLGPIEPLLRNFVIGIVIIIDILFILKFINKKKKKQKKIVSFSITGLLLAIIYGGSSLLIGYLYGTLGAINKDEINYTSSLVVLSDSSITSLDDLDNMNIGMLNNTESPDGYIIPREVIYDNKLNEKNDIVEENDYPSLMASLYSGELDAIFISSSYVGLFESTEGYEGIEEQTRVVMSESKLLPKVGNSDSALATSDKSLEEPFTILIMGVDSELEGLSENDSANGDALILVTFNPKTLNATVLSIPRDTYVPITCFNGQYENKITHASWNGTECMINTIENFTEVEIDYYVKMNFKGLVGLVDAVGGITVDVPVDMCTDNSGRGQEVCIEEGIQTLNGEEALVLSRNRKAFVDGDISRGLNQQLVIEGIINSVSNINSADQIISILDTIAVNMDTNFSETQILSFYNILMDILASSSVEGGSLEIQQLFLDGVGQTIYDESMRLNLWNYIINEESLEDVVSAMKSNLGLIEPEMIKSFSFTIDEDYEIPIIGEGPYNSTTVYSLLPDFSGQTEDYVQSWANKYGVKVSFVEKESSAKDGVVINQSLPAMKRLDKITGTLTITISKNEPIEEDPKDDDEVKDNTDTDSSLDGDSSNTDNE